MWRGGVRRGTRLGVVFRGDEVEMTRRTSWDCGRWSCYDWQDGSVVAAAGRGRQQQDGFGNDS